MGQKVNANAVRLGIHHSWNSVWYADNTKISGLIQLDHKIRQFLKKRLRLASVERISIDRLMISGQRISTVKIQIHSGKPGRIIGRKGEGISSLTRDLSQVCGQPVNCEVIEIDKPDLSANIVAQNIASQLEQRVMHRRCMQRAISTAMYAGALGIKVSISGRLRGAEMARTEWLKEGRVPLHTLKARVQYGFAEAYSSFGVLGVKVWICTQSDVIKNINND